MAGNYALVCDDASGLRAVGIGATNDLSTARQALKRLKRPAAEGVYTRLNVPGGAREEEHQDLVAHYKPAFVGHDST